MYIYMIIYVYVCAYVAYVVCVRICLPTQPPHHRGGRGGGLTLGGGEGPRASDHMCM